MTLYQSAIDVPLTHKLFKYTPMPIVTIIHSYNGMTTIEASILIASMWKHQKFCISEITSAKKLISNLWKQIHVALINPCRMKKTWRKSVKEWLRNVKIYISRGEHVQHCLSKTKNWYLNNHSHTLDSGWGFPVRKVLLPSTTLDLSKTFIVKFGWHLDK